MRRFIVSVVMLLGLAANAGDFVTGNPSLPPQKVDKIPPPADTTRYIVAADVNNLWSAAFDLRSAIQPIQLKLGDVLSVRDFGATGGGTLDDTIYVQNAIAAACVAGKRVFFPAGTYLVTNLTHGCTGWIGEPRQSIIMAKSGGDINYLVTSPNWLVASSTNASAPWSSIYGIDFNGNGLKVYTVVLRTYFTKMENCRVQGATDSDVLVSTDAKDGTPLSSTMVNNEFINNWIGVDGSSAQYGLRTIDSGAKATDYHITGNYFSGAAVANLWTVASSGWNIAGNHFYGSGTSSAYIYKPNVGTRVTGNYFEKEVRLGSPNVTSTDVVVYGPGNFFKTHVWADFNNTGNSIVSMGNTYGSGAELRHAFFSSAKILISDHDYYRTATPFAHYASAGAGSPQDASTGVFRVIGSYIAPINRSITVMFDGSGASSTTLHKPTSFDSPKYELSPYVASGSGAVARLPYEKMSDFVSVKDFGAVGDGVADDTAAVALAYAATASGGGSVGAALYFPAGTYKFNLTITRNGVTIYGAGRTRNDGSTGGTKFKPADLTKPVLQVGDGTSTVESVTLAHFLIAGDGSFSSVGTTTSDGIVLLGARYVHAYDFTVSNMGGNSVVVTSSATRASVYNRFEFFTIDSYGLNGFKCVYGPNFVTALGISNYNISQNTVVDTARALYLEGCTISSSNGWIESNNGYKNVYMRLDSQTSTISPFLHGSGTTMIDSGANTDVLLEIDLTGSASNHRTTTQYLDGMSIDGQVKWTVDSTIVSMKGTFPYRMAGGTEVLGQLAFNGNANDSRDEQSSPTLRILQGGGSAGSEYLELVNTQLRLAGGAKTGILWGNGGAFWRSASGMLRFAAAGTAGDTNGISVTPHRQALTYSASMTPDITLGSWVYIAATNSTAFTINAPTSGGAPLSNLADQRITITIDNTSGGALGVLTWNATFKLSTPWLQPLNGFSTSVDFQYDGTTWYEASRTITSTSQSVTFANLPSSTNGTSYYCSDCVVANPCAGSGTGAFAQRINGAWSCGTSTTAPDFTSSGRTALAYVAGTSDTTLSTLGMGVITNPSNANNSYTNDASTDSTRQMIKGAVTASGTAAAWGNVTTTRRQYLPKFTAKVYVPSLGTSNGQDREVFAGLKSTAPSTTGTGSDCAAQSNTNTGAWICYANATLAAYASGVNWMYVRDDGTTAVNTDSGIAVTVGLHTLVVDYTVAGQVTMSVDGSGAATFTTNLGTASTPFGPVISCGTWATLAGYSCSTPGFQVVQSF